MDHHLERLVLAGSKGEHRSDCWDRSTRLKMMVLVRAYGALLSARQHLKQH